VTLAVIRDLLWFHRRPPVMLTQHSLTPEAWRVQTADKKSSVYSVLYLSVCYLSVNRWRLLGFLHTPEE